MTEVRILATGPEMIREGARGVEPVIEELLASSKEEIQLLAFVISSGASRIVDLIADATDRGVSATVIVDRFSSIDPVQLSKLEDIARRSKQFRLIEYAAHAPGQLHAKVVVTDRAHAVIGSSNLSWGGLVGNTEVGVQLEGEPVWVLAEMIDGLVQSFSETPRKGVGRQS